MPKRIAILTGGGDCPGLNAVIRGVVRSAVIGRGWEVIGIEDGFDGFLHQEKCRVIGLPEVRGILPRGGTILGTTNRGSPFSFPILREGKVELIDVPTRCFPGSISSAFRVWSWWAATAP